MVILDVRGYDPIELFARANKFDPIEFTEQERLTFEKAELEFSNSLHRADRIFTVSEPLKKYIKDRFNTNKIIDVIPCVGPSRKPITLSGKEQGDAINFVYLGGAQPYQGLRELVIPFVKALIESDPNVKVHFISQQIETIIRYLKEFGICTDQVVCMSIPQEDVQTYLAKMDLGLLLRSPSFMNSFSQPVKLGEYLSAGMGVIFERGTGDLKTLLEPHGIGLEVSLWQKDHVTFKREADYVLSWFKQSRITLSESCLRFSIENYSWSNYSIVENNIYHQCAE